MYLLSVSVAGNGRGGNQPIITQQSFKNVLPKSIFFFFFLFCTILPSRTPKHTHTHTHTHPTTHSLPPSRLDKIVPLCLPWPRCGDRLLDWLDWLPSRLMPGAQYSPATRDAPELFVLLVYVTNQNSAADWQKKIKKSSPRFFFSFSLKFAAVFPTGLLYGKGTRFLSSHCCILTASSFRALPFSEQLPVAGY